MSSYRKIYNLLIETPIIDPEGRKVKGVLDVHGLQHSRHHAVPTKSIKKSQAVLDRLAAQRKVTPTSRARNLAFMALTRDQKGRGSLGRPNFLNFGKGKRYLNWEPVK
jgi:hypothetical protein